VVRQNRDSVSAHLLLVLALAIVLTASAGASGQTFTVINNFSGANGARSVAGLVLDQAGNLYGATSQGGTGHGTVFELSPAAGGYTETVLYTFGSQKYDGSGPAGTLVRDGAGNLYGTTEQGGVYNGGIVFELSPVNGGWSETVLHNFGTGTDGSDPMNALAIDATGNLYGTTYYGGTNKTCTYAGATYSCGTAFELSPVAGGGWTYTVLYNFGQGSTDGYFPWSSLTLGAGGNLYGQCLYGSKYGKGVLYELSPGGGGAWTEQQLHAWGNKDDGTYPYGGMVFDAEGNMYGTSSGGGGHGGLGTVFEFTPNNGGWLEHNLHGFGTGLDGEYPEGNLIIDAAGNLYGVTINGGTYGYGMVYELNYSATNGYGEIVLHDFTGGADGGNLSGALVMDGNGDLFGTTWYGGSATNCIAGPIRGCGVAFKISLPPSSKERK
jgi:uncharacterized repeat protein (TIGR03803 family)